MLDHSYCSVATMSKIPGWARVHVCVCKFEVLDCGSISAELFHLQVYHNKTRVEIRFYGAEGNKCHPSVGRKPPHVLLNRN